MLPALLITVTSLAAGLTVWLVLWFIGRALLDLDNRVRALEDDSDQ